jgi:hypothetical protein
MALAFGGAVLGSFVACAQSASPPPTVVSPKADAPPEVQPRIRLEANEVYAGQELSLAALGTGLILHDPQMSNLIAVADGSVSPVPTPAAGLPEEGWTFAPTLFGSSKNDLWLAIGDRKRGQTTLFRRDGSQWQAAGVLSFPSARRVHAASGADTT